LNTSEEAYQAGMDFIEKYKNKVAK
jgi:hypothetical protein